jgi:pimeloyl-ACP methyl ester carboxylesterase
MTTTELTLAGVPVTVTEQGAGRAVLLLHGGGGPQTVTQFAGRLASSGSARVITPVHPGFGGTPRPDSLRTIAGLADLYAELLGELELREVTVVGNSIGGWIAAELALRAPGRIAGLVFVDAVGIVVPGHPVTDIFPLTPAELAKLSFYDPSPFQIDPASLPEGQQRVLAANRAVLKVYSGEPTTGDVTLAGRLGSLATPALVVWGEADQIVDPDYGRALAAAIPGARFLLLERAGHMPPMEAPDQLARAVWDFAAAVTVPSATPTET